MKKIKEFPFSKARRLTAKQVKEASLAIKNFKKWKKKNAIATV